MAHQRCQGKPLNATVVQRLQVMAFEGFMYGLRGRVVGQHNLELEYMHLYCGKHNWLLYIFE